MPWRNTKTNFQSPPPAPPTKPPSCSCWRFIMCTMPLLGNQNFCSMSSSVSSMPRVEEVKEMPSMYRVDKCRNVEVINLLLCSSLLWPNSLSTNCRAICSCLFITSAASLECKYKLITLTTCVKNARHPPTTKTKQGWGKNRSTSFNLPSPNKTQTTRHLLDRASLKSRPFVHWFWWHANRFCWSLLDQEQWCKKSTTKRQHNPCKTQQYYNTKQKGRHLPMYWSIIL